METQTDNLNWDQILATSGRYTVGRHEAGPRHVPEAGFNVI
jgi:hypothetical protein